MRGSLCLPLKALMSFRLWLAFIFVFSVKVPERVSDLGGSGSVSISMSSIGHGLGTISVIGVASTICPVSLLIRKAWTLPGS